MKRMVLFLLLGALSLSVCSCTHSNVDSLTDGSNTVDSSLNSSENEDIELSYKVDVYDEIFDDNAPYGFILKTSNLSRSIPKPVAPDWKTTVEDVDKPTVEVTLLNKVYTGKYIETEWNNNKQLTTYRYEVSNEGGKRGYICTNKETGEVVSLIDLELDKRLQTEEQYLEAIKSMLGDRYDLSEYDLKCRSIKKYNSNGPIEYFVESTKSEPIEHYYFDFTKKINGIIIRDSISVYFDDECRYLRVFITDNRKTDAQYYHVLEHIENLDKVIEDHINENLKDDIVITKFGILEPTFLVYEGKMYIRVSAYVFHYKDSPEFGSDSKIYFELSTLVEVQIE